jgi:microcystin-dependent protein
MGVEVKVNEEWKEVADRTPPGVISAYGGDTAPEGWLLCDGTAVSRSVYANLFLAIGTRWGVGDGVSTFNLPDMRGVVLRGSGAHGTLKKAKGVDYPAAGPAVGQYENDQMQGHWHSGIRTIGNGIGPSTGTHRDLLTTKTEYTASPYTDGSNGNPRTGDETRGFGAGVNFIIKT